VLGVHNPGGDITVRAAERTDVLISHVAPGFSGELGDEEIELIIDADQNRIDVRGNPHAGTGWAGIAGDVDLDAVVGQITRAFRRAGPWASAKPGKARFGGRHAWFDITIEIPRGISSRVQVHSASGDIRIEDVTGEIALNTMSGDVRAIRTSGELALETASGDLSGEGVSGRLSAHTASGDVHVTSAQLEGFQIQTANGDILVDAMLTGDGPFRANTASGDVRLTLQRPTVGEDPVATLDFHTVSGDAHVTPPFRKTDRRRWQAGSGDSGPRIDITTVSGDLAAGIAAVESAFAPASTTTSSTNDVPLAPPAPPAPPAPVIAPAQPSSPTEPAPPTLSWPRGEHDFAATNARPEAAQPTAQDDAVRLAVLEAVERGEIDVEEALRQLEAADSMTSP
jgi:DUF4097 and DUF4098 domain-containing protein YvlB